MRPRPPMVRKPETAPTENGLIIGLYHFDDDLLEATRRDGQPRLRIYRPAQPMIVLGRSGRPEVELHLEACLADGIPILRRHGGGCAVLLDPGNIIVSVVLPKIKLEETRRSFDLLSQWLIAGLVQLGVSGVCREGISDLALAGRKISGSCVYWAGQILFYGATLLIEPRLDWMERYLAHPPQEPVYRRGRSHAEFITCLGKRPGRETPDQWIAALYRVLPSLDRVCR